MFAYAAKAVTAVVLILVLYLIGDPDILHRVGQAVEAVVVALLAGLAVFAVPNSGVRP